MNELLMMVLDGYRAAGRLWLFLDYDGTLANFAPNPDVILPDPALMELLDHLVSHPQIRIAVISGRSLEHLRELLPVPGLYLAGTYGLEIKAPRRQPVYQLDYEEIRPRILAIKPAWEELIAGRSGFYLEDKGWSLALHARFARELDARRVLQAAREILTHNGLRETLRETRVLGGEKFLEVGPSLANKGRSVIYMLQQYSWPGAYLMYAGDDDKDEEAFDVIQNRGGVAVLVRSHATLHNTRAQFSFESISAFRAWLQELDHYLT